MILTLGGLHNYRSNVLIGIQRFVRTHWEFEALIQIDQIFLTDLFMDADPFAGEDLDLFPVHMWKEIHDDLARIVSGGMRVFEGFAKILLTLGAP
jgi:hypothetical protein